MKGSIMQDLISRKAVLSLAKDVILKGGAKHRCVDATEIKLLPSTQPEQRWIPCSERLPKDFQRVLVTIVNYAGNKVVRVAEYYGWKGVFQIKENHEQWEVGEKGLLAWLPLPQPYKAESEGEE